LTCRTQSSSRIWPYWGGGRYYQYTMEVSKDGTNWQRVGDHGKNTKPSTPEGVRFAFAPLSARYIRVNMLYHSLNEGVHIVEVEVESAVQR
jgi:hypothetical protein